MALSWNEIKDRALHFSKEWKTTVNEEADAKPFLVEFFEVFGISRKRVATFEHRVKKLDETDGYIDLLWKGTILVEMKSRGKDLYKAFTQAKDYTHGLKEHELPKYILTCDFENFHLHDLEENKTVAFKLHELVKNVNHFGFIAGYQKRTYKEQDPVNIKAAELMGKLHDQLKAVGYDGHPLELYLVRLLFCLFADDTSIFEPDTFRDFVIDRTSEDGSDLGARLNELFYILNTPENKRLANIDEQLDAFPYVNGKLFEEFLPPAAFNSAMRNTLVQCCALNWGEISPAIFGSMFQSVMNPKERRNIGAHYTSETNILKLIKPLFLDELWQEFETSKNTRAKLLAFHKKISTLKFLDPACGCGNFLVVTYRELRLLELEVIKALLKWIGIETYKEGYAKIDIDQLVKVNVDTFYGIEYEEFPAQIAQVAMWLMDHQMNMEVGKAFGEYFRRLPLLKAANIVHGNALQIDWAALVQKEARTITADVTNIIAEEPAEHYSVVNVYTKDINVVTKRELENASFSGRHVYDYILGNPPFIGARLQSAAQKADMELVFSGLKLFGTLDYVTAWYKKAAQLIMNTKTKVAFVSTNSITQGEQVGALWTILYNLYKVKIHFAHRTFSWRNEAKGNAAVHVVIIGFAGFDTTNKAIYEYEDIKGEPHEVRVKNINPYLVEGKDMFITTRTTPLCNVPEIIKGSETTDDGHFMLTLDEVNQLKEKYPQSSKFIRPFIGGGDFINGNVRYCLWLKDAPLNEVRHIPFIQERIEKVKNFRLASTKARTRHWANFPTLFSEDRQPITKYLMFPKISSERRTYIPFAYVNPRFIINSPYAKII